MDLFIYKKMLKLIQGFEQFNISRILVKRSILTHIYGSTKFSKKQKNNGCRCL